MTNIVDFYWTKKRQTLTDILDRGARISDELIAIAEAARQRLSDLPDDHEGINENTPTAAVASKPSRPGRLHAAGKAGHR